MLSSILQKDIITKSLKQEILISLKRYISSGLNLYNALKSTAEDTKSEKIKNVLKKVILDIEKTKNNAESMYKFKLLDEREYIILKNAKNNLNEAFDEIINASKDNFLFETTMFTKIIIPYMIFVAANIVPTFMSPYINQAFVNFDGMIDMSKVKNPILVQIPILYSEYMLYFAYFLILLLLILIYTYIYTYFKDIKLCYKIFKFRKEVDIPYLFKLMISLNKATGMNLSFVCNNLKKNIYPNSLKLFFDNIEKDKNGTNLFKILTSFSVEQGVARIASAGQSKNVNDFWGSLNQAMIFSEDILEKRKESFKKLGKNLYYVSIFYLIFVILMSIGYIMNTSYQLKQIIESSMGM